MRFFHLSDLHIGKQLHHYNLREDQEHILQEVTEYARNLRPDAIILAGDIYDKSVPSAEAVTIFDEFLTTLSKMEPAIPILIISGNHDSAERLEYASGILESHHIHIAGIPPKYETDKMKKVTLQDEFGPVHFYMLPFFKPVYVKGVFGEVPESYEDALKKLLERESIDDTQRNVFVSHQFYTGSLGETITCDSETVYVGGIDNIDIAPVAGFDYVALGHLHGAQQVGKESIRYCGTLLKYSVSEETHQKGLTVVTLKEKGEQTQVEQLPLHPLRDVKRLEGRLERLLEEQGSEKNHDFVSICLTDEVELYQPKDRLEACFTHILEVRVDNPRVRSKLDEFDEKIVMKEPFLMFQDFFTEIQGRELNEEEAAMMQEIIDTVKEE